MRRTAGGGLAAILAMALLPVVAPAAPAAATAPQPAGTITTVAGGPGQGPALNLAISPSLLLVRGATLYVGGLDAIHAMDTTTGIVRVVVGPVTGDLRDQENVPATATSVIATGMDIDDAGNLYYGEGKRVRRVDAATGLVRTLATFPDDIGSIAVDGPGNVFVGDHEKVLRVTPAGAVTTFVQGGPPDYDLVSAADLVYHGGALYIRDINNFIVRADAAGNLTRVCCEAQTPTDNPVVYAFTFDAGGNLFFVNASVHKVTPAGVYSTIASLGFLGEAIAVNASGIYVANPSGADPLPNRVVRVDPSSGALTPVAGNGGGLNASGGDDGPATSAQFNWTSQMARDADGNIYIADGAHVRKVDAATGVIANFAGRDDLGSNADGGEGPATTINLLALGGIAVAPDQSVYFQDGNRIRRVDRNGMLTIVAGTGQEGYTGDGGPATQATFGPVCCSSESGNPFAPAIGLAFDAAGNLYISDTKAYAIRRVDHTTGIIDTVAGGQPLGGLEDGIPAKGQTLVHPKGVAISPLGQVTIADTDHNAVRFVDGAGDIQTIVGRRYGIGPVCPANPVPGRTVTLDRPEGIAYDRFGNLYFADTNHHCVLRVDPSGMAVAIAGRGVQGFAGDGGPSTASVLSYPRALATDPAGDLYIAEGNHIRRIQGANQVGVGQAVAAVGWNGFGQLGDGTTTDRHTAVAVGLGQGVVSIAGGVGHTVAAMSDGTVRAWGWNSVGELGDGTTADRSRPVTVPGLTGVVAVAAGAFHSLALKADGTVWAWGWNATGQLGDGTTVDRHTPVRVPGLSRVVSVSAGFFHSLAAGDDGTAYAWGWNGAGQLGDGTTVDHFRPAPVTGTTSVATVSAGGHSSFAVTREGNVLAWGWNATGQLGEGAGAPNRLTFSFISLPPVRQIAASPFHTLALTVDGHVYAWGWNGVGQLGIGQQVDVVPAYPVPGLSSVTSIAAGWYHSVASLSDGSARAWGWNGVGQLGDGTTTDRWLPAPVAGSTGIRIAGAGAYGTLFA